MLCSCCDTMEKTPCTSSCGFQLVSVVSQMLVILLFHPCSVCASQITLITTNATITGGSIRGEVVSRTFSGPNKNNWNYSVAVFNLNTDEEKSVFNGSHVVEIIGSHALLLNASGDFIVKAPLNINGKKAEYPDKGTLFWVGGFVRQNDSCCKLGAGPGAPFSYHGAGHGGRGGGFYQDRNSTKYFGWSYFDNTYLLGGSTGTAIFPKKTGTGGGAIEIVANNGTLQIDGEISANGFSSGNTSDEHCAGGTAGGLIRLRGNQVVITSKAKLSAAGGDSGYSSNLSNYCASGGGGGVIQIFSLLNSSNIYDAHLTVRGGRGISPGEDGVKWIGTYFDGRAVVSIDTNECELVKDTRTILTGQLINRTFSSKNTSWIYTVCKISHSYAFKFGKDITLNVNGKNALKIVSENGPIEVYATVNVSGGESARGGFSKTQMDGIDAGPGNGTNCSAERLYGRDFNFLLGGSVCMSGNSNGSGNVFGGGAIEFEATSSTVIIDSQITADGYSDNDNAGAMGGTIRIKAKQVKLGPNAFMSAKGSFRGQSHASGGIIQIQSDSDVEKLCDTKFNVSGGTYGLVNVKVPSHKTDQVQFLKNGIFEINTGLLTWMHITGENREMAYTYSGDKSSNSNPNYQECHFDFNVPIILNNSMEVAIRGSRSLSISSTKGIYIDANLDLNQHSQGGVGGFCFNKNNPKGPGHGVDDQNGGAGHGGRGGLFEEKQQFIYGNSYGTSPVLLIGGSSGSTNTSVQKVAVCGGGAIRIHSNKTLVINAAIKANGITKAPLSDGFGGSSGGTIILEANQSLELLPDASLEASGSDANGQVGGGGGGGVIMLKALNITNEMQPGAIRVNGGKGTVPGENGVVIIQDHYNWSYPPGEIANRDMYHGCVKVPSQHLEWNISMLAHESVPNTCIEKCLMKRYTFALIRGTQVCSCTLHNSSMTFVSENCTARCIGNISLFCGGPDDVYSSYKIGHLLSSVASPIAPSSAVGAAASATKPLPSVTVDSQPSLKSTGAQVATNTATKPTKTIKVASTSSQVVTPEPTSRPNGEPSEEFKNIAKINITTDNLQVLVERLHNLTTEGNLNGGDTKITVGILEKLAKDKTLIPTNTSKIEDFGKSVVEIASVVLDRKNKDSWATDSQVNETKLSSQTEVLSIVENFGINLGQRLKKNDSYIIESKNIVLGVEVSDPDTFEGREYPVYNKLSESWQHADKLIVPKEILQSVPSGGEKTIIVFAIYSDSGYFPSKVANQESDIKMTMNSKIMALKFNENLTKPFQTPIKLRFEKRQSTSNVKNPSCMFLDFDKKEPVWSGKGLTVSSDEEMYVDCTSTHATNFAILMQVHDIEISPEHEKALTLITYIGCGISLFCLALTLATFLSLETLASERTSIHKNLVIAIGLAQIIFLAGIDAVYNPIACKAVALFLHYFYMAAFTWMCCEGIHLYTKVVEVFSEGSKMNYYYAIGWGLPLFIVIVSASSRFSGYGGELACWISLEEGLIWAFVAPVLLIVFVNSIIMVMVIRIILASVTSLQNSGNTCQVKAGVKGMIVLLPLLGLTWVFGVMAVNKHMIAFQYLFAILNSLQGLFIFAFHCVGNSEVRIAYKRLHEKRTLNRSWPEHSMSNSRSHKEKRGMNDTNMTGDDEIVITKTIRSVSDVKINGDNMAMQTFGDTDSGRWSLNCPSPDPLISFRFDGDHAKRA